MVQSFAERPTEGTAHAALAANHRERDRDAHRDELDWEGFRDLYYPDTRPHNFEAIVAYGAYKRSPRARPVSEAAHLKGDPISTEARSLEAWEDEGGASH